MDWPLVIMFRIPNSLCVGQEEVQLRLQKLFLASDDHLRLANVTVHRDMPGIEVLFQLAYPELLRALLHRILADGDDTIRFAWSDGTAVAVDFPIGVTDHALMGYHASLASLLCLPRFLKGEQALLQVLAKIPEIAQ